MRRIHLKVLGVAAMFLSFGLLGPLTGQGADEVDDFVTVFDSMPPQVRGVSPLPQSPSSTTQSAEVPAGPVSGATPKNEYTNVILISLQCLRPDHLGAYGYQRSTSPNIDGLAKDSVLFENAIAQANLTPVAQMSVFTSQYPRVNGMVSFEVSKDAVSNDTLPEILRYYGYTTAATVSSPEFFLRYDAAGNTAINPGDVFSRSFDYFSRTKRGPGGRSVRQVPSESLEWLKANKDKKFFLWIASGLLHMPYGAAVPPNYRTMYDPPNYTPFWIRTLPEGAFTANPDPSYEVFSRVLKNRFYWDFKPAYQLTDDDVSYVNARYDAGVTYTDLFIGDLMKQLEALKLTDKTLVILHSIHGEDLGEKGDFFHYDVTDTVVKNALLMRFPKGEFQGRRIPEQVQGIDIMPTVLNYLDIPVPHSSQGKNLLPFMRGEAKGLPNEYVYIDRMPWWEYTLSKWYLEFQTKSGAHFSQGELGKIPAYLEGLQKGFAELGYPPGDIAIRSKDWKLVLRKNLALLNRLSWWSFISGERHDLVEMELYDLNKDPREKVNVAKEHPEVVAELREKLLTWDVEVEKLKAEYSPDGERLIIPYP